MVMPGVAMVQSIRAYCKSYRDHRPLKIIVVDDIYSKQRQAGGNQRQYCAVYSACNGSHDPKSVPIGFKIHSKSKDKTFALLLQVFKNVNDLYFTA